jgi:peptidyl-prolyl cis-trans isomerase C
MLRTLAASVALLLGCSKSSPPPAEVVARGEGITVDANQLRDALRVQPALVRGSYATLEKKKELVDEILRQKLLVAEARRQGIDRQPEVIDVIERLLVSRLLQSRASKAGPPPEVSDEELKRLWMEHQAEFQPPGGGHPPSVDELRPQLLSRAHRERRESETRAYVEELKKKARVSVNDAALEKFDVGSVATP